MDELHKSLAFFKRRLAGTTNFADEYAYSNDQFSYFRTYNVPKKRGGSRRILEAKHEKLLSIHKQIHDMFRQYQGQVHPAACAFIKGKSTNDNAKRHVAKKYVLHLDIADFFDSIEIDIIIPALRRLGATADLADYIARLITVDGVLRQGLCTSPDISNHCLYGLDQKLQECARTQGLEYTRYGDDMTFSGDVVPDRQVFIEIVESEGFIINKKKTKLQKRGANQYVTGLTVFDERPRIPRRFKKRLRLRLYMINKYGFRDYVIHTYGIYRDDFDSDDEYEHYIEGKMYGASNYIIGGISYINSVEPARAKELWKIANKHRIQDYGIM